MANRHVAYKDDPFEDNGNHIIKIPEADSYSRSKGIIHSIPQIQDEMKRMSKPHQNPYYNQAYKNLHREHTEGWGNSMDNYEQSQEMAVSKQIDRPQTAFSGTNNVLPPAKLMGSQFEKSLREYRPQKPYSTSLIPVSWNSCQCPRLETEIQERIGQQQKKSFITPNKTNYYDRWHYKYLDKFAGEKYARLVEPPNSMFTLTKKQQEKMISQTQPDKKKSQQYKGQSIQFMNQTKKIFGNSNFYYNGENFQRADELKQTQYNPQSVNQLKTCLYYDDRTKSIPKTTIQNNIIEGILSQGTDILQNASLVDQLFKLKNQKLLKNYAKNAYATKDGKVRFIYNDYHQMGSKGGYSRGTLGTFYTR